MSEATMMGDGTAAGMPAFDFVVEEGKVAEFARATGAPVGKGDLAPVTFLAASALWMMPENSVWHTVQRDYRRVLHGEQRFDYPRGLPVIGTRYRARQHFGRSFEKAGSRGVMEFTEVITSFWTEDESRPDATMTALTITLPEHSGDGSDAPRPGVSADAASEIPAAILTHVTQPLTITDFVRYQGASGDFNPIHHDAQFAQDAGYPSPFAVGMLSAGVAAAQLGEARDIATLRSFQTRWKAPAWPGDRLTYAVRDGGDDALEVTVTRPDGSVHMLARGEFA
ncbi:MaoC/PaaZ C-terminal domain-containing protein [Microbacterium sp. NPDC055910]|uniref:MaoC/PaaZ C-terminal domain-containing protein n=1 Tax=Microbacterium sp. NPDC055910 TaxID=3345659 RepID=UPI0035D58470